MIEDDNNGYTEKTKAIEQLLRETGVYLGRTLHLGICTGVSFQENNSERVITIEYEPQQPRTSEMRYKKEVV